MPGPASAPAAAARSSITALGALKSELGAKDTPRGTVVALPGDVLFDFDKASIRADAEPIIGKLAQLIAADPSARIAIEGYSDSEGADAYNLALSARRAEAVQAELIKRGVDRARLSAKGVGEGAPVAPNTTAEGRQRNRRVEVILSAS